MNLVPPSRRTFSILGMTLVAVLLGPSANTALAQKGKDKVLFVSNRDDKDKFHIYIMNPDGSGQVRLSKGEGSEFDPALSPDAAKIAYVSFADKTGKKSAIHVMNIDGSQPTPLTKSAADTIAFGPSWSPDGKRLAFTSMPVPDLSAGPPEPDPDLYIVDADGKNLKRLGVKGLLPVWSPDGKQLLYTALVKGQGRDKFDPRLYIVNADGSGAREFIKKKAMMGRWSPDGTRLVYMGDPGNDQPDVLISKADGSEPVQLTDTKDMELGPEWSPDGKRIIFTRVGRGPAEDANLFAVSLDGKEEVQLTRGAGMNFQGGGAMMLLFRGKKEAK